MGPDHPESAGVVGVDGCECKIVAARGLVGVCVDESGVGSGGGGMLLVFLGRKTSPNGSDFGRRALLELDSAFILAPLTSIAESSSVENDRNIFKWLFRRRVLGVDVALTGDGRAVAVSGEESGAITPVTEGCVVESMYNGVAMPFSRRNRSGRSGRSLAFSAGIVI